MSDDVTEAVPFVGTVFHPSDFSELYVNMIRAGEEGGILDRVLERLAILAEKETVIRARIKAAVRYPLLVVVALVAAVFVLMKLVVPQFVKVYERFECGSVARDDP